MRRLCVRLAVWLLRHHYLVGDAEGEAFHVALHDLKRQVDELRRDRDQWKTLAIVRRVRGW